MAKEVDVNTFQNGYTGIITPPDALESDIRYYRFNASPFGFGEFEVQVGKDAFSILKSIPPMMKTDWLGPKISWFVDEVERLYSFENNMRHPSLELKPAVAAKVNAQEALTSQEAESVVGS
jgi:hypothetical protein